MMVVAIVLPIPLGGSFTWTSLMPLALPVAPYIHGGDLRAFLQMNQESLAEARRHNGQSM
jgi:hypothetical protein